MIFCTVGTTHFPFSRLLTTLHMLTAETNEEFIIQDDRHPISYTRVMHHMKRARAIVCHGGAGTILMAITHAKVKPFVVPRLKQFGEHIDDHQLYFTQYMKNQKRICSLQKRASILSQIREYIKHPPKQFKKRDHTKLLLIHQLHKATRELAYGG